MNAPRAPFRHTWGMPILLGVLTAFGLTVGLLGDGIWDGIAALCLAIPLLVAAYHVVTPRT